MPLTRRAIHRMDRPLGHRIDCISGSLWITSDGDPRDIVLSAGESHVADRDAPLLVFALEPALLRVSAPIAFFPIALVAPPA
jgi:hypothetical protein